MSLMAIAAAIILCGLSIFYGFRGEKFMGRPLGGDFVAFYVTGKILNEYQPARIYDISLEVALQHETLPGMSKDDMLPFAHAPYVAQIYRPFALLPYKWAYIVWLIFSLFLYSGGLLPNGWGRQSSGQRRIDIPAVIFRRGLVDKWVN